MAGRNEGCGSIGCLGICFIVLVAMCTGGGSDGPPGGGYTPAERPPYTVPATTTGSREWFYIHGTLNVRSAPNRNAPVVRTLSRGDLVQLGPKDANGWARLYTGAIEDEYVYRDSDLVRTDPPSAPERPGPTSRQLHVGSRGGCYYISGSGRKTYVDRSECAGISASEAREPLSSPSRSSSQGRRRSGGRQLHVGPRGGCYYINGNGNKTYVDRSECS